MSNFIYSLEKIHSDIANLNQWISSCKNSIDNIRNSDNYIKGLKILNKESNFRAFLMGILILVVIFISLYVAIEERTWGKGILTFIVFFVFLGFIIDYGISPIITWIESKRLAVKKYKNLLIEIEQLDKRIRSLTTKVQQKEHEFGVCVEQNIIPMVHQNGLISFKEISQNLLGNLVNEDFLKGVLQEEVGKGNLQKIQMNKGDTMYKSLINEPYIKKQYISYD